MEYFEKIEKNPYEDLYWNLPEKKQGKVNIIGGNTKNFRVSIKTAEFLAGKYPIEKVDVVLPDVLKSQLPSMDFFQFLSSTNAGSFAGEGLSDAINSSDYNLIVGDLSKNNITGQAVVSALNSAEKPVILTRDTLDLIAENNPEKLLTNENIILFGSMPQIQKIFRAVYYPKMLLLSQPLNQVAEILHKFTLSYQVKIVTLCNGQILVAEEGTVKAIALEKSGYSPIMFWSGEAAAKIMTLNLFNPNDFIKATVAGIFNV